jgi:TolA-binding protein
MSIRRWLRRLLVLTLAAGGVSSSASCASPAPHRPQASAVVDLEDAGPSAALRVEEASAPSLAASLEAPDAGESSYTVDPRRDFGEAEALFRARRFSEAKTAYAEVMRKYPYSLLARRAELRLADILFERGEFGPAASAYDKWVHDHRSDQDLFVVVARRAATARCRLADAGPCFDDYDAGF